jgi:hypothetical protein
VPNITLWVMDKMTGGYHPLCPTHLISLTECLIIRVASYPLLGSMHAIKLKMQYNKIMHCNAIKLNSY